MFDYMGGNPLAGPGRNNWDMALLKDFGLPWFGTERSRLQFRWETFNTFNHPQWGGVNAGCSGLTPPGAATAKTTCRTARSIPRGPRALSLSLQ
jgi:hypothetical protein